MSCGKRLLHLRMLLGLLCDVVSLLDLEDASQPFYGPPAIVKLAQKVHISFPQLVDLLVFFFELPQVPDELRRISLDLLDPIVKG